MLVCDLPNMITGPDTAPLKDCYASFVRGETSLKSLNKFCVIWSYDNCLDYYIPIRVPLKPLELVEFDKLNKFDKEKFGFIAKGKIDEDRQLWLDERDKTININKSNYDWLKKIESYFKWSRDLVKSTETRKRINLYEKSHI